MKITISKESEVELSEKEEEIYKKGKSDGIISGIMFVVLIVFIVYVIKEIIRILT